MPIFVLVETVVLYSVWKFRMKPGEEEKDGPPIHGNTRLEVIWTALPAILIVGLCTYAYTVLRSNEKSHPGAMVVNVTERQFAFEFSYPQSGGKQDRLPGAVPAQGPAGRLPPPLARRDPQLLRARLLREDRRGPRHHHHLRVTPTRLGTYPAECTELCGAGHSLMRATVRVVTPAAFKTWLSPQKPNGPPPVGTPPANAAQPGIPGASLQRRRRGQLQRVGRLRRVGQLAAPAARAARRPRAPRAGKAVFTGAAGCCATATRWPPPAPPGPSGPNLDQRLKSDCATAASMARSAASTLSQCIQTAITKPYAYLPTGFSAGIMPATFARR